MNSRNLFWILVLALFGVMMVSPGVHSSWIFLGLIMAGFLLLYAATQSGDSAENDASAVEPQPDSGEEESLDAIAGKVLKLNGRKAKDGVLAYEGSLQVEAQEAIKVLDLSLNEMNRHFWIESIDGGETRLVILPEGTGKEVQEAKRTVPNLSLHWGLLLATFVTTTWAGASHQGINLFESPGRFTAGLPYAFGLMLILGAHELGHYLTARRYGMDVTPPYFIPVPFALGTFGAFISMKTLPSSRRNLFDVAVAGPLAGLAFAIPALLIGLPMSTLVEGGGEVGMMGGGASLGSSVLLAVLAKISLGADLSSAHSVILHPLAFAGWLGLLLTAFNLIPIGQLDGGHISYALFGGRKASGISVFAMVALFILALFVWPGLLFFAILVFLIAGRKGAPPQDDVTPLGNARRNLGYAVFVLLLVIVVPLPHGLYESFGLHCPYV